MNAPRFLLATAAATALGGAYTNAAARDLSASPGIVRDSVAGHAYRNGGVSLEDAAVMRNQLDPYDLRITFSEGKQGAYVADVKLLITDASGRRVFGLKDAGPLTDVNLPAGHYHVAGRFGGIEQGASVDVKPGQPTSLTLHWLKDAA